MSWGQERESGLGQFEDFRMDCVRTFGGIDGRERRALNRSGVVLQQCGGSLRVRLGSGFAGTILRIAPFRGYIAVRALSCRSRRADQDCYRLV